MTMNIITTNVQRTGLVGLHAMLLISVLLLLSAGAQADFQTLQANGKLQSAGNAPGSAFNAAGFDVSRLALDVSPNRVVVPVLHRVGSQGELCVRLIPQLINNKQTRLRYNWNLKWFLPRPGSASAAPCEANITNKDAELSFNVYVQSATPYDIRVDVPQRGNNDKTSMDRISVVLIADRRQVGGIGPAVGGRFSNSRWIQDPVNPASPALLLVSEAVVQAAEKPAPNPPQRSVPSGPSGRELASFSLAGHRNFSPLGLADAKGIPLIEWKAGESARNLYLQTMVSLSQPAQGLYCVRAIYRDPAGGFRSFEPDGQYWSTGAALNPAAEIPASCRSAGDLMFQTGIDIGNNPLPSAGVRLSIAQGSTGSVMSLLDDARILLSAGGQGGRLAGYVPEELAAGSNVLGAWLLLPSGERLLLLQSAPSSSTRFSRSVELAYFSNDGTPLLANGVRWDPNGSDQVMTDSVSFSWDNSQRTPTRVWLCAKASCKAPLRELSTAARQSGSFRVNRADLVGVEKAYLVVDWGDPIAIAGASVAPVAAAGLAAGEQVAELVLPNTPNTGASDAPTSNPTAFRPMLGFGSYQRVLTACRGRLVSGGRKATEPLSLRNGLQVATEGSWPAGVTRDDTVSVVFDESRNGGPCAMSGLASAELRVGDLFDQGSKPVDIALSSTEPLFVGYVQYLSQDYREVRARWVEALRFFDKTYQQGRASGQWIDALVFSGAERRDVRISIEPPANFVSKLGDVALIDAKADELSQTRTPSEIFADQVENLQAQLGDARINLLYFDNASQSCASHEQDIEYSGLNIERAVVIAAIDGYRPSDTTVRSVANGLVDLCADTSKLRIYAFDARETNLNRDWDRVFSAIQEDLSL